MGFLCICSSFDKLLTLSNKSNNFTQSVSTLQFGGKVILQLGTVSAYGSTDIYFLGILLPEFFFSISLCTDNLKHFHCIQTQEAGLKNRQG